MIYRFIGLCFSFAISVSALVAQDSKVIIVPEKGGNIIESKPTVVSGSTTITGSPESHVKAAYRTWEQKCDSFEKKLMRNNGKNLLVFDCGEAKKSVETQQSGPVYTYKSSANYKIRVVAGK